MGLALMPQAGIAIGMALVADERLPEIGGEILAITVASTIFFETCGPFLTSVRCPTRPRRPEPLVGAPRIG